MLSNDDRYEIGRIRGRLRRSGYLSGHGFKNVQLVSCEQMAKDIEFLLNAIDNLQEELWSTRRESVE
jgi:hypothetical protein